MIYDQQETVDKILSKKHSFSNQEFIIEKLLNIDQLYQEQDTIKEPINKNSQNFKFKMDTIDNTISLNSDATCQSIDVKSEINIQPLPIAFKIKSSDEIHLKILFLKDEPFFPQFRKDLEALGAQVTKNVALENVYEIKIEINSDGNKVRDEKRLSSVKEYIKNYFSLFDSQTIQTKNIELLSTICMNVYAQKVNESIYEICGLRDEVAKVKSIMVEMEEKVIEDEVIGLKLFQVRILFVNKFIMNMRETYGNLKIMIDARNRRIQFKGTYAQIKEAKKKLNDILSRITLTTLKADEALINLIQLKEIDVVNWLKSKVS